MLTERDRWRMKYFYLVILFSYLFILIYLTRKLQEGLVGTRSVRQCDGSVSNQQGGLLV